MIGSKVGGEKYYVVISLILGLMILVIAIFWIYSEYFGEDEINWETCRQSLLLKSGNLPNAAKLVQDEIPIKCKTEVVNIDFIDYDRAGKLIMDVMASCWSLYGEGKIQLYSQNAFGSSSKCFECARIHFTGEVKPFYSPVRDMNSLPDVKPVWDRLNELIGLTSSLGSRGDLSDALNKAKSELEAKKSSVTGDELIKLNANVDGAQKELDHYIELENEFNSVSQEYSKLQIKYRHMSDYASGFNWINYLTKPYANTGKTYGQYFYPNWEKDSTFVLESPFKGFDFANGLSYDSVFDASKGDLIISVVHSTGAVNLFIWEEGAYSTIVPHQTSQKLNCKIETIPA